MQEIENVASEDINDRVYELGYLLVPTINTEDISLNYGEIKHIVNSFGGEIISDDTPKMINLAYPMTKIISNVRNKFDTAYFGWIKFTMNTLKVLELKKNLDLNPIIIRFLILKTVKENTIASKRFVRPTSYHRAPSKKFKENETIIPINKEEIDKEIDALVAA